MSLMAGGMLFGLTLWMPRYGWRVLLSAIIAALVFAPLIAFLPDAYLVNALSDVLPTSWLQRLVIWSHAGEQALNCLPLGCGADYARALHADGIKVIIPGYERPLSVIPVHPHNLFLQIWLETGLIGVGLILAMIMFAIQTLKSVTLQPITSAIIAATLASIFVSAMLEMSMWQVWRLSTPALAVAMIVIGHRATAEIK